MESLIHRWFNRKTLANQQQIASVQMDNARKANTVAQNRLMDTIKELLDGNDELRLKESDQK